MKIKVLMSLIMLLISDISHCRHLNRHDHTLSNSTKLLHTCPASPKLILVSEPFASHYILAAPQSELMFVVHVHVQCAGDWVATDQLSLIALINVLCPGQVLSRTMKRPE